MDLIRDFAGKVGEAHVIEELDPFMEDEIKAAGYRRAGKELTGNMYRAEHRWCGARARHQDPYKTIEGAAAAKRPPALSRLPGTALLLYASKS